MPVDQIPKSILQKTVCHVIRLHSFLELLLCDLRKPHSPGLCHTSHVTVTSFHFVLEIPISDYYFLEIFAGNILGQCVSVSVEVARSENNGLKFC